MKICRILFLLFFILVSFSVSGQKIRLTGSGSGYQNATLRFYSRTDPVTGRLKPLLSLVCDEKGSFTCELDCRKSETIFIKAGIYNLHLYISDSSRYELSLPDWIAKPGNEDQNPFFIETETIPEVVNNKNDINNLIREFDSEYNPVFNFTAERIFRNYKKEEISDEIRKLDKYSAINAPPYFAEYIRSRLIMLNLVTSSAAKDKDIALEYINTGFNPFNQASLDLAEQMFTGYFDEIASGQVKDLFARSISIGSLSELRSAFTRDGKIVNRELTDFVILLNLCKSYFEHTLPGDNTRKIISMMRTQGETELIRATAVALFDKINISLPGILPPVFSLPDTEGKMMELKDFSGKYLLLSFARSDNQVSLMELGIIKTWQKKFLQDLSIVTIITDKDFKAASARLKNMGISWTLLDGSERERLEFNFDLKMYPSFLLLDREGKIIANPCTLPSENLEMTINKILSGVQSRSGTQNRRIY